jgi:hypothetical protein
VNQYGEHLIASKEKGFSDKEIEYSFVQELKIILKGK